VRTNDAFRVVDEAGEHDMVDVYWSAMGERALEGLLTTGSGMAVLRSSGRPVRVDESAGTVTDETGKIWRIG